VEEVETVREWYHAESYAHNSNHVDPFYDDEACRNVPQFMFPRTREKQHQEKPMQPLFEASTFRCYIYERISIVAVHHSDDVVFCYYVNIEDMLQHPAALVEQKRRRRVKKFGNNT
jgi:hypothetical protein